LLYFNVVSVTEFTRLCSLLVHIHIGLPYDYVLPVIDLWEEPIGDQELWHLAALQFPQWYTQHVPRVPWPHDSWSRHPVLYVLFFLSLFLFSRRCNKSCTILEKGEFMGRC